MGQYRLLLLLATRVASSTVDDVRKAKPKWRTQRHAHSCYKSCGSPAPSLPPPPSPLSSTLFHSSCLPARTSFFVQLRKLLSVCPLPASFSSCFSFSPLSTVTFHYTSAFFRLSHTHTLAHCIRLCLLVFYCTFSSASSFCHHSPVSHCYLKTQREGAEKSL